MQVLQNTKDSNKARELRGCVVLGPTAMISVISRRKLARSAHGKSNEQSLTQDSTFWPPWLSLLPRFAKLLERQEQRF